jgi:hypothetical protein
MVVIPSRQSILIRNLIFTLLSGLLTLMPMNSLAATKTTKNPPAKGVTAPAKQSQALSTDQLQKQKEQLAAQAAKAKADAHKQQQVAAAAADKIAQAESQIQQLQSNISETNATIAQTQGAIEQKDQDVANLESQLTAITKKRNALLSQLYILTVSYPDDLRIFSSEDLSSQEQIQTQIVTLKQSVSALYDKTNEQKAEVATARNDLVRKNEALAVYQQQQAAQKDSVASYKLAEAQLQNNAQDAVDKLNQQAADYQKQEGQVEEQIGALLTQILHARAVGTFNGGGPGVGTFVHKGDPVGVQGHTGFSTGDHVHEECRPGGGIAVSCQTYIDNGTIEWALSNFHITQGFGRTSFSGAYRSGVHTGTDLQGPINSIVHSPCDCTVILNADDGAYGHAWAGQLSNGLVVLLGHMQEPHS